MDLQGRIERNLERAVTYATAGGNPSLMCEALKYAVFPGGARIRPRLCLAVALAAGDKAPQASSAAATAIELLHCASLVMTTCHVSMMRTSAEASPACTRFSARPPRC
jgi:geranylgeranyl diphosphate synthase type II